MEEKEKKPGFFKRLVSGLTKTRDNIVSLPFLKSIPIYIYIPKVSSRK